MCILLIQDPSYDLDIAAYLLIDITELIYGIPYIPARSTYIKNAGAVTVHTRYTDIPDIGTKPCIRQRTTTNHTKAYSNRNNIPTGKPLGIGNR